MSDDNKSSLILLAILCGILILWRLTAPLFAEAEYLVLPPEKPVQATYERFPIEAEVIATLAESHNIAPEHLLAISAQESSLGRALEGDGDCSKGWFHINICEHANPDAEPLIGDIKKETKWVIKKLKEYGYETNVRLAIAKYNRPSRPNFEYADRVLGPRLKEIKELLHD